MIDRLHFLRDYGYYFQYTLNAYGIEIESGVPPLNKKMDTFRRLADTIGRERVIWRYDPIFINGKYDAAFHKETFARIAETLKDHTEKCMIGFVDHYRHIRQTFKRLNIKSPGMDEMEDIALSFRKTADRVHLSLAACTSKVDLRHLGIPAGSCIDKALIERITCCPIIAGKDRNQRSVCNCMESIDIGSYESCLNGCIYCYAVKGDCGTTELNRRKNGENSPLLVGELDGSETIKERKMRSLCGDRNTLF